MGKIKDLAFDSDALFYLADLGHASAEIVLVAQEELIEYVCEESDTVAYDNVNSIKVVSTGKLDGGAAIPLDELFALTVEFIKEECGPSKA